MKKTIAAILSLTMALTMLAGCGDNDSSKTTANSSSANTDAGSSADNGSKWVDI